MLVRVSIPLRGAASLVRRETSSLSRHGNVLGGGLASPSSLAAFDAWHAALAGAMRPRDDPVATTSDLKAVLRPFVAKDAVFRPPTYFAAWTGREEMLILLESASMRRKSTALCFSLSLSLSLSFSAHNLFFCSAGRARRNHASLDDFSARAEITQAYGSGSLSRRLV